MKKITFYLFFLFLIESAVFSQVKEMESTLQDVVISATKTETPTLEVASSYTLITSSDLEKLQQHSVIDVLKLTEGISIAQQGGPGRLSSIFMRGANSEHLLIMIDGVKVNDPSSVSNSYDISTLMTDNIDRIEIVRGPQSTLYGSDAIAGIINIITKQGAENSNISFLAEGGTQNYYKAGLSLNGKMDLFNYSLSAARLKTDGISAISSKYGATENDGYSNNSISSRFGINFVENINLDLTYRFLEGKTDLDQAEKNGDDPNYVYKIREHVVNTQLNGNFFNKFWETKLGISYLNRNSNSQDDVDEFRALTSSKVVSKGDRVKLFWQNNFRLIQNNNLTLGIESENEKAESESNYNSQWGNYGDRFGPYSVKTTSIYLQDQIRSMNDFFGTIGFRYDNNELFGSKITYRIAPAYFVSSTSTKLKGTYGTGFKAPSLFRLYDPSFGNIDLKPETSKGWDIGIEQFLLNNSASISLTYFNTQFDNMFGYDESFKTININKVSTSGIEFSMQLKNYKNFTSSINYTYTKAVDESPNVPDENINLIRRPKHTLNLVLDYVIGKLDLLTKIKFVGEREDNDFLPDYSMTRVVLGSYTLVDFATSYQLTDFLKVQGRIENIFDVYYEEVLYYGTLGRSAYLGIEVGL